MPKKTPPNPLAAKVSSDDLMSELYGDDKTSARTAANTKSSKTNDGKSAANATDKEVEENVGEDEKIKHSEQDKKLKAAETLKKALTEPAAAKDSPKQYKQFYLDLDTRERFEDMLIVARRHVRRASGKSFSDSHLLELLINHFYKNKFEKNNADLTTILDKELKNNFK